MIDNISIDEITSLINNGSLIKKKRERFVVKNNDKFYKIWVKNWTQGNITKNAIDTGYYNNINSSALDSLIYDNSGQRGYITKSGICLDNKGWKYLNNQTTFDQRKIFMLSLLENSFISKGIYVDLSPSNIVLLNNSISLIDLDSFKSFSLIFENKTQWYETFDIDAWWKPHETAIRDLNKYYTDYFKICLDKQIDFNFKCVNDIEKLLIICKNL